MVYTQNTDNWLPITVVPQADPPVAETLPSETLFGWRLTSTGIGDSDDKAVAGV